MTAIIGLWFACMLMFAMYNIITQMSEGIDGISFNHWVWVSRYVYNPEVSRQKLHKIGPGPEIFVTLSRAKTI